MEKVLKQVHIKSIAFLQRSVSNEVNLYKISTLCNQTRENTKRNDPTHCSVLKKHVEKFDISTSFDR